MYKLNVIYEDNHIIVVEKKPNIPSQSDKTEDMDMLTMVKDYIKEKYNKPGNVYVGLIHRLDRPVGGIMVFAKTSKAASRLSEQVRNKDFGKEAGTICAGNDSRLKNKRTPLPHAHKLKDVPDFAEQIKAMNQEVARYGHHLHLNKNVIDNISYSGNKIDLIRVEQIQNEIILKLNLLNQKIAELKELETTYKIVLDKNFSIIESGGNQ